MGCVASLLLVPLMAGTPSVPTSSPGDAGMSTTLKSKAAALVAWSKEAPLYGKLTYVGPREKPTQSVIFHAGASSPEGLFQPFQSPGVSYLNDTLVKPRRFSITAEEQARILATLSSSGFDQDSERATWSLVLVQVDGEQHRGVEWLMDRATCKKIVQLIGGSLSDENSAGKDSLPRMAP